MVGLNSKIFILIVLIIILFSLKGSIEPQIIAPDCFEKEDCRIPVKEGYCEALYDCVAGKCYSDYVLCPELCYGGEDEDQDGLTDCKDPECYDSPSCPCRDVNYAGCRVGMCYCKHGIPQWNVIDSEGWCRCM